MTHGSARTWRASLRSPDRDGTLVGWPCTRFIGPGAELDRAVRLLKKKYRQYRDYEFDELIALRIDRVASWGL
jgi:hypothetical protein